MTPSEYHKIQTVYKRDPATKHRTLLEGQFSTPELEFLKDLLWVWTEKINGTNVRIETVEGRGALKFKGRSDAAQMPPFLLDRLQELFTLDRLRRAFPDEDAPVQDDLVLYGEGYGARIQKGGGNYISNGVDFILFDVRVGRWWLKREAVVDIAQKLGCLVVPVVGVGTLEEAVYVTRRGVDSMVAQADVKAEGLVMRPQLELFDRAGRRIITKIKTKDFA